MGLIDVIGFMAAVLTTASFVPQAVRTWRTRETRGISLLMYAVFSSGVALWVVYGFLAPSWPVFAANAVTLVFALAILVMKVRYERPLPGAAHGSPVAAAVCSAGACLDATPES